ncbi:pumilio homolog 3-like [Amphiura filiformis]|uniref:pumilio homolog 3-like n=1 Tax=Amphiura filiformis TaxID=82378 RepID=UPI003B221A59
MLSKMDKPDKKRTGFKGKKSAKKFQKAAKQKTSSKPEQQTIKPDRHVENQDQNVDVAAAKIEKNNQMLQKKKNRQQLAKGDDFSSPAKDGSKGNKKPFAGDRGDRKAAWKKENQTEEMGQKGDFKGNKGGKDGKDDRPKLEEMSVKDRKLVRKKVKTNYDLSQRSKQIWGQVREGKCSPVTRAKLLEELYGLIKGKAKELVKAHDTVRVIECCVQYGNEQQKQAIFDEVKDDMLELCKSKYAKFYVLKVLKYGTRQQRDFVIKSFYGNVCKLVQHSIAAEVVENAYNNWANAQHRSALLEEFYGAKYAIFKEPGVHTLGDILAKHPESKQSILDHMLSVLTPLVEKSVIKHTIVHKALLDFLTHASINMRAELIQMMREIVVQILHTHDGAKAAMYCFWFGTTKDRKHIIKSFKTYVERICKEEFGHRVLLALFDVVDDTKLVSKVIIEEMMQSASALAQDQYGRKVLLYLLTPRNPTHFHPDVVKLLQGGDNNPNSKKDVSARRKELLEAASPALLQLVTTETKEMMISKSNSQLMLAVLEHSIGDKADAFQAISDLAAEDFTPSPAFDAGEQGMTEKKNKKEILAEKMERESVMHVVEHPSAHFFIRCLLLQEKAHLEKHPDTTSPLFSDTLLNTVSVDKLRSWLGSNRSAFVLVSLAESPRKSVQEQIISALKPVKKTLKTSTHSGGKTLYAKVFES